MMAFDMSAGGEASWLARADMVTRTFSCCWLTSWLVRCTVALLPVLLLWLPSCEVLMMLPAALTAITLFWL